MFLASLASFLMNEHIGNVTMLSSDRIGKQYQCPQFLQHCCGRLFLRFGKLCYCCAQFRTKTPAQIRNLKGAPRRNRAVGNSVVTCTRYSTVVLYKIVGINYIPVYSTALRYSQVYRQQRQLYLIIVLP